MKSVVPVIDNSAFYLHMISGVNECVMYFHGVFYFVIISLFSIRSLCKGKFCVT